MEHAVASRGSGWGLSPSAPDRMVLTERFRRPNPSDRAMLLCEPRGSAEGQTGFNIVVTSSVLPVAIPS